VIAFTSRRHREVRTVSSLVVRWITVVVVLTLTATARGDDDLARAKQLEASLDYDQALAIVDRLLSAGGADPARYVELHLLAGRLAAGLDRPDIARDHFARVLALRPATALPEGTSPKLTEPFAAARARSTPLAVRVTARGGLVTLEATDPLGLVVGIAVHVVSDGKHADLVERGARRLVLPPGAKPIEVAALDADGNRVWIGASPPEPVAHARPDTTRPLYARWSTYAVLAGVTAAAGGIAAWRFQVAQDDWNTLHDEGGHEFSELQAIEDRGRRWGLAANVLFGAAAASAIVAAIVGVRTGGRGDVVVGPSGAGVVLSGRF